MNWYSTPQPPQAGPNVAPAVVTRHAPPVHGPYRTAPRRNARDFSVPMLIMVIGVFGAFFLVELVLQSNPAMFLIGAAPSTIGLAIGLGTYLLLDRWEPEPPRLLVSAFFWGGGIATIGTLIISLLLSIVFASVGFTPPPYYGAVIEAPVVEEIMKAGFLFFMLTGWRRHEMRTLVDHLVYAGFAAFGFAYVENLMYFAKAETLGDVVFMTIVRTGFNLFGHAFYTSATAVAIYFARKQTSRIAQVAIVLLGLIIAMLLHAAWNGSALFLGIGGLVATYFVVLTPLFVLLIVLAVRARRREGAVLQEQLPRMVEEGLISHEDASWISSLQSRKALRDRLKNHDHIRQQAKNLVESVSELAIIRERIRTHGNSPFLDQEHYYLVHAVAENAQQLPDGVWHTTGYGGPNQPQPNQPQPNQPPMNQQQPHQLQQYPQQQNQPPQGW